MNIFKALLATFLLVFIEVILALGLHYVLIHHIAATTENLLQYNALGKIVIKLLQYSLVLFIVFKLSFSINTLKAKIETIRWRVILIILITSIGYEVFSLMFLDIKLLISYVITIYSPIDEIAYSPKQLNIFDLFRAIMLAPILEELFFRKVLFSRLLKKYTFGTSAVVSSLCFTLIHIPNWLNLVTVFIFGLICCFIYVKTKNILYPIFLHFTGNLIVSLPYLFSLESFNLGKILSYNGWYWSILILGIGLTLFGLRRISKAGPF